MRRELKQFEYAPRVDGVGLGGGGKYLFVTRQLQVVDAVELPASALYLAIERPCPAVVAFHGDAHRQPVTMFMGGDAFKELAKAVSMMLNVEFVDEFAVG